MDVVLAPDVYVNASVALGSPPERVVTRLFGRADKKGVATPWILDRVRAMLSAIPEFKEESVEAQVGRIGELVSVLEDGNSFSPEQWEEALVAAAQKAKVDRIITDHPDLLALEAPEIEFVSTEAWLVEQSIPPPPPPGS